MRILGSVLLMVALFLTACSEDDPDPTPTPTSAAAATSLPTTSLPVVPTTSLPAASATASGPTDGTVAPQNAGSTDPVDIKSNPDPVDRVSVLRDLRMGAHPENGGWDRVVFEFADVRPTGRVEYVDSVSSCGSGLPVDIEGDAILLVRFEAAQAHDDAGRLTVKGTELRGPGFIVLEALLVCDFEAQLAWAIGLKSEQRFKVTNLSGPTRVVIDIKQ